VIQNSVSYSSSGRARALSSAASARLKVARPGTSEDGKCRPVPGQPENGRDRRLPSLAEATLDWAEENWVAFDKAKTEAMFLLKRREKPTQSVRVGDYEVQFNQHWLGIWIDSKMTPKEHHSARMKKARKAMHCIRRLTGRLKICPDACRRALAACVQASALYGPSCGGTIGKARR